MDIVSLLGLLNPLTWIERAVQYSRRPKLQVYFDPAETFHTRTLVDERNRADRVGFYVHLMVRNAGAETAKRCTASLIRLKLGTAEGQYKPHPGFLNPLVLKWAHELDYGPRDIDPDLPRRLDLCIGIQQCPQVFSFMTERTPRGTQIDYPPGTYLATIRVGADNAQSVDASFEITYRGTWNEFQVKPFSQ